MPTGSGKTVQLAVLLVFFISSSVLSAGHPCLYFSGKDLSSLRKEASGPKAFQFARLRHWGDSHLKDSPPADIGNQERQHEFCFSALTNFGLLYQITGETKYLDAGKRWIEALLTTPGDSEGDFFMGDFVGALAHAYDLFYKGLPPDFRNRLKAKLIQVLEQTRYGASHSWWSGIYTHHDFWIPMSFMGVAALCLKGEYPGANSIVEFSAREIGQAMDLLGDQGYWPEGVADWVYGMAPTFMFFDALRRSGGPDFYQKGWMRATARARLMHWLPDDRYMYLGDSFPSGRYGVLGSVSAHLLMHLASVYRDSHTQWLAFREAAFDSTAPAINFLENPYSYGTRVAVKDRQRHGLAWQFLWYDPSVKPASPDTLPADLLFKNWDTVIFRAGWGASDPVLAFAGGHLLGRAGTEAWKAGNEILPGGLAHTHQNAGAIYLWADRRFPLAPPSFGGRDGRFHSTVMVDGQGQLFDPGFTGRVTAFESGDSWAMAALDLTGAYSKDTKLNKFTRTLVYLKPRTILLFDRLSSGESYLKRYEWLLHTEAESAQWTFDGNSLAAVPVNDSQGEPWLIGKVFPSYRYYFEEQSMYQPDGKRMNRALSVTIVGRMPSRIEIPALLHVPAPDEDTGWLNRVLCVNNEQAATMIVPDGPYFMVPTGPQGEPTRTVIFAKKDTLSIPSEVPGKGLIVIVGLFAGVRYRLESKDETKGQEMKLVPDPQGKYISSAAGNLVLRAKP